MVVSYNYMLSLVKKKNGGSVNYFLAVISLSPGTFIYQPPIANTPFSRQRLPITPESIDESRPRKDTGDGISLMNVREKMRIVPRIPPVPDLK